MNLEEVKASLLASKAELEARVERTHKHTYHKDEPVSANFKEQVKQTENDELVRALEQESLEELLSIAIVDVRQKVNSDSREILIPVSLELPLENVKFSVPQRGGLASLRAARQGPGNELSVEPAAPAPRRCRGRH